jgi:hypothetical protein
LLLLEKPRKNSHLDGIGGLRGGKMGTNGKMQYNPGWESGSMKTLAAHGLAGGIMQDRMGGSFGAGFLSGSLGSYLGSSAMRPIAIFVTMVLVIAAARKAKKKFPSGWVYSSGLFIVSAALFMGIGGLRGGKMVANGKMQYNPGWESGSMKTLAAHGLAGGIMQDRMGGSFGLNAPVCAPFANLPPPITEMVPPTTASLAVLPIISDIFFECPDEPR